MAIENTDLLLIQRGSVPYRETVQNLKNYTNSNINPVEDIGIATTQALGLVQVGSNLSITPEGLLSAVVPDALVYMGVHANPAQSPPTTGIVPGQFWIWEGGNATLLTGASYGAIQNKLIDDGDHIIWSSSNDWDLLPTSGDQGVVTVQGEAPIEVVNGSTSSPIVGIRASSNQQSGSMSSDQATKLSGIETGAQINVNPSQVFTNELSQGTLTLMPGGDETVIPEATSTKAGLMTGNDKATLDGLVTDPPGVNTFTAGDGLTDTGTAKNPKANVDFGPLPNGVTSVAKVMPYSIAMLGALP